MFKTTLYVLFPIYSIVKLCVRDKKYWDSFTRVISTFNALQCIHMVAVNLLKNYQHPPLNSLYYIPDEHSINSLFIFSGYLFVDGIFQLPDLYENRSGEIILSIIHHVVGGFGIYLIADTRLGFFLGFYFAMTEISTPFLNISWVFRNSFTFFIFYFLFFLSRIITIPILLSYLHYNQISIYNLTPLKSFMCFYASYALIILNTIWYLFLTIKISKLCIKTYKA